MISEMNYDEIPIKALNISARMRLSECLNSEQVITTQNGFARDYRGIAQLMGFSYATISSFSRSSDPFKNLLECYERQSKGCLGDLIKMIEQIERFDVIDDLIPFFQSDAEKYNTSKCQDNFSDDKLKKSNSFDDLPSRVYYDAYVCYANEDFDFVENLSKNLETPETGIKLCIRDRDLPLGTMEYDYFTRIIQDKCRRVLIILSPDFLKCPECEFQARFAAGLAIEQRSRKLIPIIYKSCNLPPIIRMLTKIDLSRAFSPWAWNRLINSIRAEDFQNNKPVELKRLALPYSVSYDPSLISSSSSKTPDSDNENNQNDSFLSLPSFPAVPTAPPFVSESSILESRLLERSISNDSETRLIERSISSESNLPSQTIQKRLDQGKKWIQSKFRQKFKS